MAKVCYFTGRRAETGNTRSHAMNANRRTWKPNLQKVRVLIDGKPKKVWVSTLLYLRLMPGNQGTMGGASHTFKSMRIF